MLLDVLEINGKLVENPWKIRGRTQQAISLLTDFSTIFDLDKISFWFPSRRVQNMSLFTCKIWNISKLFGPKKRSFICYKKINSKKLSDPRCWVVSNHLLSYQITWNRGFLTTGHAPLHGPEVVSLCGVRNVNLALGQNGGVHYTSNNIKPHMSASNFDYHLNFLSFNGVLRKNFTNTCGL